MTMRRLAAALFLVAATLPAAAGDAGRAAPNPERQPLAAVRCPDAATLRRILTSPQARTAGADEAGVFGRMRLPGFKRGAPELSRIAALLADDGVSESWYCLMQAGGSIRSNAAALGFRYAGTATEDGNAAAARLVQWGFEPGSLSWDSRQDGPGRRRMLLADDAAATKAAFGGQGGAEWRGDFLSFMAGRDGGLGLWVNPRPLSGAASLATGVDFRLAAASLNLAIPAAASLVLSADKGALGFTLRLHGLFTRSRAAPGAVLSGVTFPSRPDARLAVPSLSGILELFGYDDANVFAANLDWRALLPRSLVVAFWLDEGGEPRWSLAGLLNDGPETTAHCRRRLAWLALAGGRPSGGESGGAPPAVVITHRGIQVVVKVAAPQTPGGEGTFILAAGRERDLPDVTKASADLPELGAPEGNALATWDVDLSPATREALRKQAATLAAESFGPVAALALAASVMPGGERGSVAEEDGTLVVRSPGGLAAWLPIALAPRLSAMTRDVRAETARLTAARLRFLLDVATQFRFRGVRPDRLAASGYPGSLTELPGNGDGADWLDAAFPSFPGWPGSTGQAVAALAGGRRLDDYAYRVSDEDGTWRIVAESASSPALRIDATGVVERRDDATGGWSPWSEADSVF